MSDVDAASATAAPVPREDILDALEAGGGIANPLPGAPPAPDGDSIPPDEGTKPSMGKLLALGRGEWRALALGFGLTVASEGLGLYMPLLTADGYDAIVDPLRTAPDKKGEVDAVMRLVMLLLTGSSLLSLVAAAITGVAGERVVARLRGNVYAAILGQEMGFFDQRKTGELNSRIGSDTVMVQKAVTSAVPELMKDLAKVIVTITLMGSISGKMTAIMVGTCVLLLLLAKPFGAWVGAVSKRYTDAAAAASSAANETFTAMRTVRAFGAEDMEHRRYMRFVGDPDASTCLWRPVAAAPVGGGVGVGPAATAAAAAAEKKKMKKQKAPAKPKALETTYELGYVRALGQTAFGVLMFYLGLQAMNVMTWVGFYDVVDGNLSIGKLSAFTSYIWTLGMAVAGVVKQVIEVNTAQGSAQRIFEIMERVPAMPLSGGLVPTAPAAAATESGGGGGGGGGGAGGGAGSAMVGEVRFEAVSFAYPTRPDLTVLKDFTLTVPPNSTCALVGASGSGKSTALSLLLRYYDVTGGVVRIDGHDVRELDPRWLRTNMGFVQQEPAMFSFSIRDNLTYNLQRPVSEAQVRAACEQANAHEFVVGFPEGYDTLVGERGVRLSGGQKQRLAIARALLVDPRILLLDEATSALDAESEHAVQEAIQVLMRGRTTIVVAHRLSTVRDAAQIVVVDQQCIVDVGTHAELMERCERYQELVKRQIEQRTAAEEEEEEEEEEEVGARLQGRNTF